MKIVLTSDNKSLDEVVVVAYGTTTKASFTGSAAVMKDKDMSAAKSSLVKSLEGKMAGVNLGASTGDPGSDQSILIRGIGSIALLSLCLSLMVFLYQIVIWKMLVVIPVLSLSCLLSTQMILKA